MIQLPPLKCEANEPKPPRVTDDDGEPIADEPFDDVLPPKKLWPDELDDER
jgi:hypothetical protein